jgi:hypothetical protein
MRISIALGCVLPLFTSCRELVYAGTPCAGSCLNRPKQGYYPRAIEHQRHDID